MKNIVLGTSLVLAMVLGSGCGSDGDSKVDIDGVTITYKNSAALDMSEYMIASKSQTNAYVKTTFTNDSGKKEYKNVADATTYPEIRYDINGSIAREYDANNILDVTNTTLSDRIRNLDASDGSTMDIARFVNTGDYVQKQIQTLSNGAVMKMACKVSDKLDSKVVNTKTYNDVIKVVCDTQVSRESTTLSGKKSLDSSEGTSIAFFAKGNGVISSVIESCSKTTIGDKVATQECEKTVEEIISIH
jgi:hypothetical protein